jgi:hypothetical protein
MSAAGAASPRRSATLLALAPLTLALLTLTACARGHADAQASRLRCLELIDALPRLEAEERAWPRSDSLACEERGAARAAELRALRAGLEESCGQGRAKEALAPLLEAASEVEQCAACAPEHARHCNRARELFVEMETALGKAGLR